MASRHHFAHLWHRPPGSTAYEINWCASCCYGALTPRPSTDELRAFYDPHYFSRYAGESCERESGPATLPLRRAGFLDRLRANLAWRADRGQRVDEPWVHAMLGGRPGRICDLGCANGDALVALRDLGHEVIGIEVDPIAVARARARGLEVHQGTAEDLPTDMEQGRCDAVVLTHVLEHCLDPVRAARNAAALLAPGGALFVEVPNNDSLASTWSGPCWFHCDAGRHLNFFTPASMGMYMLTLPPIRGAQLSRVPRP
jgi:2-polyprenyl-3-methyl-5-hydroxy-6-metoxy-1,4-benzoquinol methylase